MELEEIYQNVIYGEDERVVQGIRAALEEGVPPEIILNTSLIPAMDEVGRLFSCQEFYVPEMLLAARAMQSGINLIKPLMVEQGIELSGHIVIGTVKGDLHDIGKNLVVMMLEGAGFEVNDLGVDVEPERFVDAVKDGAQIIGMSALLTTTTPAMKVVIDTLEKTGLRDKVKVMVGGAPVSQSFADQVGADGYAPDASSAVILARNLSPVTSNDPREK